MSTVQPHPLVPPAGVTKQDVKKLNAECDKYLKYSQLVTIVKGVGIDRTTILVLEHKKHECCDNMLTIVEEWHSRLPPEANKVPSKFASASTYGLIAENDIAELSHQPVSAATAPVMQEPDLIS